MIFFFFLTRNAFWLFQLNYARISSILGRKENITEWTHELQVSVNVEFVISRGIFLGEKIDTTFKRCFVHVSMKLNAENSTIASLIYFTIGNIRLKFLTKLANFRMVRNYFACLSNPVISLLNFARRKSIKLVHSCLIIYRWRLVNCTHCALLNHYIAFFHRYIKYNLIFRY